MSGEINVTAERTDIMLKKLERHYAVQKPNIDRMDGLSMDFGEWRFNVHSSNTEPLLRINVESRDNRAVMQTKRDELLTLIKAIKC